MYVFENNKLHVFISQVKRLCYKTEIVKTIDETKARLFRNIFLCKQNIRGTHRENSLLRANSLRKFARKDTDAI